VPLLPGEERLDAPVPGVIASGAVESGAADSLALVHARQVVAAPVHHLLVRPVTDDLAADLVEVGQLLDPLGQVEGARHRATGNHSARKSFRQFPLLSDFRLNCHPCLPTIVA